MEKPRSVKALIAGITPQIYQNLKTAVEIGKWASGEPLSSQQKAYCLQAIIAYENQYLAAKDRTGMISKSGECEKSQSSGESDIRISDRIKVITKVSE